MKGAEARFHLLLHGSIYQASGYGIKPSFNYAVTNIDFLGPGALGDGGEVSVEGGLAEVGGCCGVGGVGHHLQQAGLIRFVAFLVLAAQ